MLIRDEQDAQDDPGWWLVTPMILPDGSAVAINRGFVPLTLGEKRPAGQTTRTVRCPSTPRRRAP